MKPINQITAVVLSLLFITACTKTKDENIVVIRGAGNIDDELRAFRGLAGAVLNTTPGAVGGRREINWDAVPDDLMGQKLPLDFFNPVGDQAIVSRQRGLGYTDEGSFMVSASNFAEINPDAAAEFASFSGNKIFANTESSLWDIVFEVPGERQAAFIHGFGAVFADVDKEQSVFIEFFNGTESKGKFYVPAQKNGSKFSFLGVYFKAVKITGIKVGHEGTLSGSGKDISQGGAHDLVTLDDIIYNEPVANE
jgi:hypothetical protein